MEKLQQLVRKIFASSFWRQLSFCLLLFIVFLTGILSNPRPFPHVAARGVTAYLFFLACFYSGRWVFHRLIKSRRSRTFLAWTVVHFFCLTIALICGILLLSKNQPLSAELLLISSLVAAGCMLTGFITSMARRIFVDQLSELQLKDNQKQSELDLLQAQLNPHFLFNTLNNLYGISITQHQRIPSLLLKLSELLRYSVYETRQTYVPLTEEIDYIKNYIEFEKLRTNDRLILDAEFDLEGLDKITIPPLLLIVFVENAFKFAKDSAQDEISIFIKLRKESDQLSFFIRNSYTEGQLDGNRKKYSGVGLVNVIKRLSLLYPDTHKLTTKYENGFFEVGLSLNIT